jgi:hypothetical protein
MHWRRELSWNPRDLAWRIAVLFMIGSAVFAVASFPLYAQNVDPGIVGTTFVIGSFIFTAASLSAFVQVITDREGTKVLLWQPDRKLWWAALVQLAGTLFFNFSTIHATIDGLSTEQTNHLVWAPDLYGSTCFLVASQIAWHHVCGRMWCSRRNDCEWWSAILNYVGAIFFMFAAIAAFTIDTDEVLNATIVNSGTFAGAICFFVGAYLLLPQARTRTG